ncbi:MAG: transcription termination/antitermination protein NusG [Candidatus Heimdallarchaeota archaeon]
MNWYILRVAKGQDNKVKKTIETHIENTNVSQFVNNIIVPIETYFDLKKGKRVKKERPLLAGYLLVEADLSNEAVLNNILTVKGVLGFMGESRHTPSKVPLVEVERLLGRMAVSEEVSAGRWIEGENVKIIAGPFSSFNATIKSVEEQKKKMNVVVKIFGRPTDVELDYAAVEKVL